MINRLQAVKALSNYMLELSYDDSIRLFDMNPYLDKPMFEILRESDNFNKVRIAFNTVEWENGADIDPESLYELSIECKDTHNK